MPMTKVEALAHISALYRAFNLADSDSEDRADWTDPRMAAFWGCEPLDKILRNMLTAEEREEFYANL